MLSLIPWWGYVLLGVVVLVPVVLLLARGGGRGRTLTRAGLTDVANMELPDFVRYLTGLFGGLGYSVERAGGRGGETGVDLVLVDRAGRRTAVCARHFKAAVDTPVIRQVAEGAAQHRCKETLVVTTRKFTNGAIAAAEQAGTLLWDAGDLADAWERVQAQGGPGSHEVAASVLQAPPPGSYGNVGQAPGLAGAGQQMQETGFRGPQCPNCGSPTQARSAAGKEFWLCSRFPRCNGAIMREK